MEQLFDEATHAAYQDDTPEAANVQLRILSARELWDTYSGHYTARFLNDLLECPCVGMRDTAKAYIDNGFLFGMEEVNYKRDVLWNANEAFRKPKTLDRED